MMLRLPIISPTKNQHIISTPTNTFLVNSLTVRLQYPASAMLYDNFTKPLWITGHSLGCGGANSTLACLQNVFKCGWGLSASTIKIITYLHIYLINAQHINFLQSMNKNVYTMLTLRCCGYFNSDSCCYSIAKLYHLLCHICNFPLLL